MKLSWKKVKNIVRKGENENAGYHHFILFPQRFLKAGILGSLIVRTVVIELPFPIQALVLHVCCTSLFENTGKICI